MTDTSITPFQTILGLLYLQKVMAVWSPQIMMI